MSGRRVPLSNNPNAANSPYRAVVAAAAKQKRSYANIQREEAYSQQPPAKKQMLDAHHINARSLLRQPSLSSAEGRIFTKKSNAITAFDRKLEAARRPTQHAAVKVEKQITEEEDQESIRQWQKHYRKQFPQFVFYFESVPEDIRIKYAKQVALLGAREEKFFSNSVTHVVTTRSIPSSHGIAAADNSLESNTDAQGSQPQTINPSLLDRSSESAAHLEAHPSKARSALDAAALRKGATYHDLDARRHPVRNADVLYRAKELGIKIWALEKLQRMMTTMHTDLSQPHGHNTRSNNAHGTASAIPRSAREADLSQLLRNERINGPSDRDPTVASKEVITFKGPFIYIHDVDEKQRPIMVREYAKVAHKEEGEWPQFRSVANGKCPFVEEDYSRRDAEREAARQRKQAEREKLVAPRTRAAAAEERMAPPRKHSLEQVVGRENHGMVSVSSKQSNPFNPPPKPAKVTEVDSSKVKDSLDLNVFAKRAPIGRLFRGEPVASGLQQSNITSAIRSQMISSTAAAPGVKAGTSKEIHGLQRKVLERNNSNPPSLGLTSSHRMTDLSAATREDAAARSKRSLAFIDEELSTETEDHARRVEAARKTKAVLKRNSEKQDPKPGYCENCMDKFDDFDEHVLSRKHRKFAEKSENWFELDSLLSRLVRPIKDDY